jgi:hypothetical protein
MLGRNRSGVTITLVIAAVALAPRAWAVDDLQLYRATLSPSGVVDLTVSGSLDWVHWGYHMPAGTYGALDVPVVTHKMTAPDPTPIGNLQIMPPASGAPPLYWRPIQSSTMSFRWTDGTPVRDPGAGVSVPEGIGAVPESSFTLGASTGPELRQLSIFLSADCRTELPQVDASLGSLKQRLTSDLICLQSNARDHKITVRYSSSTVNPPPVIITIRSSFLDDQGPMIFAATLGVVTTGAGGGPADGGTPDAPPDAGPSGGAGQGGGGGARGGAGGAAGSGAAGSGGSAAGMGGAGDVAPPAGRVLACAVAATGVRAEPRAPEILVALALLGWLGVRRRPVRSARGSGRV